MINNTIVARNPLASLLVDITSCFFELGYIIYGLGIRCTCECRGRMFSGVAFGMGLIAWSVSLLQAHSQPALHWLQTNVRAFREI